MTLTTTEPETPDNNNQKRPWILVAAAVAALALIGGLIYAGNTEDDQVPPINRCRPSPQNRLTRGIRRSVAGRAGRRSGARRFRTG